MTQASTGWLLLLAVTTLSGGGVYRSLSIPRGGGVAYLHPQTNVERTLAPTVVTLSWMHVHTPASVAAHATVSSNVPTPRPSVLLTKPRQVAGPLLELATEMGSRDKALAASLWAQVACLPGRRQRFCLDPSLLAAASGRDRAGLSRPAGDVWLGRRRRPWLCEAMVHWALESAAAASSAAGHSSPSPVAQRRRATELHAAADLCSGGGRVTAPSVASGGSSPPSVVAVALHDGLGEYHRPR
jgi:hypothetical protein